MAIVVELPRLSDTMEEGVIAKWHIAEGDKVKRGQVIAEIETDKATMEFESFDAGTVLKLVAPEGEALPLGAPIAVLGKPDENADEALASAKGGKGKGKGETKAEAKAEPKAKEPQAEVEEAGETGRTSERGAAQTQPSAPAQAPEAESVQEQEPETERDDARIAASPLARRLAREHGLSLSQIPGSGPHGRVIKDDVEKAAKGRGEAPAAPAAAAPRREDERMKLSQMRKAIARRMAQANTEIPHFYLTTKVAMDNAVAMREQLKSALPDTKISYNDLVLLAATKALLRHPEINAYWDGETIVRRGAIHMGVAVAIDEGLIVPVIFDADHKSLSQIAVAARDLGTRARDKQLKPEEMSGSTFTVSNLGMFGITEFAAVINPGEGAILAVGAIVDEPVVKDGQLVPGKTMNITMACDHRVMDGATGARFLATMRQLLEEPLAMLA